MLGRQRSQGGRPPDSLERRGLIQWGGITLDSSKRQTEAGRGGGGTCSFARSPICYVSVAQNSLDVSYADGKYIIACLSSWKCKSFSFLFLCKCMFITKLVTLKNPRDFALKFPNRYFFIKPIRLHVCAWNMAENLCVSIRKGDK